MRTHHVFTRNLLILVSAILMSGQVEAVTLRSATCQTGGSVFAYDAAVTSVINKYAEGIKINTVPSACYVENAKLIFEKMVEIAHLSPDIAYDLYHGKGKYEGKAMPNLRAMWISHSSYETAVVLKESPIHSYADLKGKKVGTGGRGMICFSIYEWMLREYGLAYKDMNQVQLSVSDMIDRMKEGTLDAAFTCRGFGDANIADLASSRAIRLLPFPKEKYTNFKAKFPPGTFPFGVIPRGTYKGQDEDIPTTTIPNILVTTTEVDEKTMYSIAKALFSHKAEAESVHLLVKETTPEKGVEVPIPLHPGIERYFREKGWIK